MIDYLTSIYKDPYKDQNARLEYGGLLIKPSETFADFYTCFLHLAGQAKILKDDSQLDLFDKLTMELQRTVLPVYSTLTTVKTLADECLSLDQGLRRLKAHADCVKARSALSVALPTKNQPTASTTYSASATPLEFSLRNQL